MHILFAHIWTWWKLFQPCVLPCTQRRLIWKVLSEAAVISLSGQLKTEKEKLSVAVATDWCAKSRNNTQALVSVEMCDFIDLITYKHRNRPVIRFYSWTLSSVWCPLSFPPLMVDDGVKQWIIFLLLLNNGSQIANHHSTRLLFFYFWRSPVFFAFCWNQSADSSYKNDFNELI